MRRLAIVTGGLMITLGCMGGGRAASEAEAAARAYLEAGARPDASPAELVMPGCEASQMGRFGPVRLFGAPLVLDELELAVATETEEEAQVLFRFVGHLPVEDPGDGGRRDRIERGGLDVDRVERSGRLLLRRTPSGWRVTCP